MNQFEIRINKLRLEFKAQRIEIQKGGEREIGHLNTAIGEVKHLPEAVEILREARDRAKEALLQSMQWSRLCYRQQRELLEDQYRLHLQAHPSKRAKRRAMREAERGDDTKE